MGYVDFDYYDNTFPKLLEEDFDRIVIQAEKAVDVMTHRRASTATGYKLEQVKDCVCNLINAMADQEAQHEGGKVLSSVSNAGYSETYQTETVEERESLIRMVCERWLSGTGLMGAL